MIKEAIILLAEDIEDITISTLDMCKVSSLEECFPAITNKMVEIDGNKYVMTLDVKLDKV